MDTLGLIEKAKHGDKDARDSVVMENVGLIWSIVRRFLGRGQEAEDLFQIGSIGLLKAVDKFDSSFDVRFSTYAVPMITGEIKRFLRDDGAIKVSRRVKETSARLHAASERLEYSLGREPSMDELCDELDVSRDEIIMALESSAEIESLYKVIYQGEGNPVLLMDKLEYDDRENEGLLNHMVLKQALGTLKEKERELIRLRYFMDKTQTEIASELGISQVQVSRLEKRILGQLREDILCM